MTGSTVFEITRLQFYTETYTREDEYESRHLIKEGVSRHQGRQQGCPVTKRRIMATKDNCRDHNNQKKNNSRRKRYTQEN